jgi:hypothetical protein
VTIIKGLDHAIYELSKKHAEIIEENIKFVLDKFNIHESKVILNYHRDGSIEIHIKVAHFKIENEFTFNREDFIK